MPNANVNKVQVVRGGQTETLIDLTGDTITASALAQGYTAHDASGAQITGTSTGGTMVIRDEADSHGGTIRHITSGSVVQGTINITSNGTVDVAAYADAAVSVTPSMQSKTVSPTTSQQTVSPDSGYAGLSSVTVNAMPTGTAGTPSATKGTVSNHAVNVTPSVTNQTGYISGGTKTGTAVSVSASELVSGNLPITSNGTNIDVANYSTVSVNVGGGGGSIKMGVLRPDAELVDSWTYDKYIVDDESVTIPAYSTSTQTLLAQSVLDTVSIDTSTYYYGIVTYGLSTPVYSDPTVGKGRWIFTWGVWVYDFLTMSGLFAPTGYPSLSFGTDGSNNYAIYCCSYSSATATSVSTSAYGGAVGTPNHAFNTYSNTATVRAPALTILGSTSYCAQTYWNYIEDIRYQYIIELYRVEKGSNSVEGFSRQSAVQRIANAVNSASGTLV